MDFSPAVDTWPPGSCPSAYPDEKRGSIRARILKGVPGPGSWQLHPGFWILYSIQGGVFLNQAYPIPGFEIVTVHLDERYDIIVQAIIAVHTRELCVFVDEVHSAFRYPDVQFLHFSFDIGVTP